ncbi:MAG: DUF3244 domain-containing protein [Bacteroidaceae bacterium]|nr:DUF3244 domain-containing protein [Bacteroidaceae bacterium]
MRTKFYSLLTILATVSILSFANDEIPLRLVSVPEPGEPTNPRSIECEVTASIDSQVLTVSFSELTASQIVITDSANLTVFNQNYAPANSIQSNLSTLPSGSYILNVYALGYWWYGYFNL